jgi:hypothetical protein
MTDTQIRLGVITEVHIVPPGTPEGFWHNPFLFDQAEELFGRAVQRCIEAEVDAIAILGDLTHYADPGSFGGVRRVLETIDLPVYVLPGNHDLDKSQQPLGAFQQALDLPNVTIAPRTLALTPEIDLSLVGLEPGGGDWKYAGVLSRAVTGNEPKLNLVLTHFPAYAMAPMLTDAGLKHAGDLGNRQSRAGADREWASARACHDCRWAHAATVGGGADRTAARCDVAHAGFRRGGQSVGAPAGERVVRDAGGFVAGAFGPGRNLAVP